MANYDYEHVMVLSGDQLYQMDFNVVMKHHKETGRILQ